MLSHSLWRQERFRQTEILGITKFTQHCPGGLQATSLDKDCVQVEESCLREATISDSPVGVLLDHLFDSLELLQLQGGVKAFPLSCL